MANMFSDHIKKQIPKYMNECLQPDPVSANLWMWSERLEKWGKILFWAIVVFGIITSITAAIVTEDIVSKIGYNIETKTVTSFKFDLLFLSILEFGLYAFLEYCAYHALALLIGALASITQNTNISTNIALYKASKEEDVPGIVENVAPQAKPASKSIFSDARQDSYSQVVLANSNDNTAKTAAQRTAVPKATAIPATENMWTCKNCGTQNKSAHGQCKKCGTFRS